MGPASVRHFIAVLVSVVALLSGINHAVTALVSRHEALRTGFRRSREEYEARVQPPGSIAPAPVEVEDWSALPRQHHDRLLEEIARTAAWEPIDLDRPPLFRVRLLQFGKQEYALFFVFHHIICDAWSIEVLLEDLSALYAMPGLISTDGSFWARLTKNSPTRGSTTI